MECYNCKSINSEEHKLIRFFRWAGKNPFFVENVPATVCRVCGPTAYSGKVLSVIDRIEDGTVPPIASKTLRVFDFANPQALADKINASPAHSAAEED